MAQHVDIEESSSITTIWLDRPDRLNAINAALVEDLLAALEHVRRTGAGAVLLAGRGRAFCAGHDLKEDLSHEPPEQTAARVRQLQEVTQRIRALDVAVVAAVHGHAIGAGLELALCCDLVVAADDTSFRFPEVSLGLSLTNGATRLLPLLVGSLRAKQLVLLGEPFDTTQAHQLGLVNVVASRSEAHPVAVRVAERLADCAQPALGLAKKALNDGIDAAMDETLDLEVDHALQTAGPRDST